MRSAATCDRKSLQGPWRRAHVMVGLLALLTMVACGGGGSSSPRPPLEAGVSTLTYVVTKCRDDGQQYTTPQELRIRQPNGVTVTAYELPVLGPFPPTPLCALYGASRLGVASMVAGPFQRLGVSPDGSTVIFEIAGDFSIVSGAFSILDPPLTQPLLPPDQEGIFVVRADGTGLRRLGPPSREPSFRFAFDPSAAFGIFVDVGQIFSFSPDGRTVAFTDLAPGPSGEESAQIFTMDISSGARRPITRLLPLVPQSDSYAAVRAPFFLDAKTIGFVTATNDDGVALHTVKVDGSGEVTTQHAPMVLPGGLDTHFRITAGASSVAVFEFPGMPVNPYASTTAIGEVFVEGGGNFYQGGGTVLQLTNFHRIDTGGNGPNGTALSVDGRHVLFEGSANPPELHGSNPDEICQLYSIDTLGQDLHQLTHFKSRGTGSLHACGNAGDSTCYIVIVGQDLATDTVVFNTDCNADTNPNGADLFAMRSDGTGFHRLTETAGTSTAADGTVTVELPGPYAYPEVFR